MAIGGHIVSHVTSVYITLDGYGIDNIEEDICERVAQADAMGWGDGKVINGLLAPLTDHFGGRKHPQLVAVGGAFNHTSVVALVEFLRTQIPWATYFQDYNTPCVVAFIQDEDDEHPYPVVLYGAPTIPWWAKEVNGGAL